MLLKAEKLHLRYGKQAPVVNDVNFSLAQGEFMVLIGPNGSGKSTLLKSLAGILKPYSGAVYINNQPVHQYSKKALARYLAFLPQSPLTPEDFTVREIVSFGRNPHLKWNGRMTSRDWDIVDEAITRTRLTPFQNRRIDALSGGERQRAWLALALAQKPKILLLDEPTTFLDICYQFEMLELIKSLNITLNISTVMVLHDINQAARYANRITVVNQGRIDASGTPENVISTQLLADVFNIKVNIIRDNVHDCPFMIPLESLRS